MDNSPAACEISAAAQNPHPLNHSATLSQAFLPVMRDFLVAQHPFSALKTTPMSDEEKCEATEKGGELNSTSNASKCRMIESGGRDDAKSWFCFGGSQGCG